MTTRTAADPAPAAEHYPRAYLFMLSGSLAFAVMGALSHLAGERCEWQVVAAARTGVAFVLSAALAAASGVRLVWLRPATLWLRSVAGSLGVLCAQSRERRSKDTTGIRRWRQCVFAPRRTRPAPDPPP